MDLHTWTIERMLRLIAGIVVFTSVTLGVLVDSRWLALTAFAGLNLFQSAFTNWCPVVTVLRKAGFRDCQAVQR